MPPILLENGAWGTQSGTKHQHLEVLTTILDSSTITQVTMITSPHGR